MLSISQAEELIQTLEEIGSKLIHAAELIKDKRHHNESLEKVLEANLSVIQTINKYENYIENLREIYRRSSKKDPPAA